MLTHALNEVHRVRGDLTLPVQVCVEVALLCEGAPPSSDWLARFLGLQNRFTLARRMKREGCCSLPSTLRVGNSLGLDGGDGARRQLAREPCEIGWETPQRVLPPRQVRHGTDVGRGSRPRGCVGGASTTSRIGCGRWRGGTGRACRWASGASLGPGGTSPCRDRGTEGSQILQPTAI